jgi:hypothetical protein
MARFDHQFEADIGELRSRKNNLHETPEQDDVRETAKERVMRLNMEEQKASDGKARRTYGRTLDGTGEYAAPKHRLSRKGLTNCSLHCPSDTRHGLPTVVTFATKECL